MRLWEDNEEKIKRRQKKESEEKKEKSPPTPLAPTPSRTSPKRRASYLFVSICLWCYHLRMWPTTSMTRQQAQSGEWRSQLVAEADEADSSGKLMHSACSCQVSLNHSLKRPPIERSRKTSALTKHHYLTSEECRKPQPPLLLKKLSQYTSYLYCSTPPVCIAVILEPLGSEERELLSVLLPFVSQNASHLYCNTPPICIAVLLRKSWWLWSPECSPLPPLFGQDKYQKHKHFGRDGVPGTNGDRPWDKLGPVPGTNLLFSV